MKQNRRYRICLVMACVLVLLAMIMALAVGRSMLSVAREPTALDANQASHLVQMLTLGSMPVADAPLRVEVRSTLLDSTMTTDAVIEIEIRQDNIAVEDVLGRYRELGKYDVYDREELEQAVGLGEEFGHRTGPLLPIDTSRALGYVHAKHLIGMPSLHEIAFEQEDAHIVIRAVVVGEYHVLQPVWLRELFPIDDEWTLGERLNGEKKWVLQFRGR